MDAVDFGLGEGEWSRYYIRPDNMLVLIGETVWVAGGGLGWVAIEVREFSATASLIFIIV